ncbi:MAG: hypothetical protein JNM85_07115 [Chthonomonas sp.]|nr:hypothetical protein [Chthonomonas sp.]
MTGSLCLRVDLDYVPWDSPDGEEFGHGEPAMVLKLLEQARHTGAKYHFFTSNRSLRAFPTIADAVLNDGHHLDWLCKQPDQLAVRWAQAKELFAMHGHAIQGCGLRGELPIGLELPEQIRFVSAMATPGETVERTDLRIFKVETRPERDALRSGQTARAWMESVKTQLRAFASHGQSATVVVRPQVLAKVDVKLAQIKELVSFTRAVGMRVQTLREMAEEVAP